MKLQLLEETLSKLNYFLKKFPSKEWSGPAWYSLKANKAGFPVEFTLEDFHPLDLGGHSSTEWEADDLAKILKKKLRNNVLKKCYMGLIHSHHTMGAFFSGTDTETLCEMAPVKGFYPSLIVATSGKAHFAFGFSYKDQYGKASYYEVDDDDIKSPRAHGKKEWVNIAKGLEKKNTVTVVTTHGGGYGNGYSGYNGWGGAYQGQSNLFNQNDKGEFEIGIEERKKVLLTPEYKKLTKKNSDKAFDFYEEYCNGKMRYIELQVNLEKIGIPDVWNFIREARDASTDAAIEYGY